jgi:hypothetical protein
LVRLPSGRRIGFLRHDGASPDSTEIHADVEDNPQDVVRELLQALALDEDAVSWIRGAVVIEPSPEAAPAHAR